MLGSSKDSIALWAEASFLPLLVTGVREREVERGGYCLDRGRARVCKDMELHR